MPSAENVFDGPDSPVIILARYREHSPASWSGEAVNLGLEVFGMSLEDVRHQLTEQVEEYVKHHEDHNSLWDILFASVLHSHHISWGNFLGFIDRETRKIDGIFEVILGSSDYPKEIRRLCNDIFKLVPQKERP